MMSFFGKKKETKSDFVIEEDEVDDGKMASSSHPDIACIASSQ